MPHPITGTGDAVRELAVRALSELGFTALEAQIYAFLLQESPVTGYRIAQAIGKPVANTYKAIQALAEKGALLIDDGASRLCRAVPATELLGRMDRTFQERRTEAARLLEQVGTPPDDARVYQLRTREQALERFRQMLARCVQVALIEIFPEPLEAVKADIEAAAVRGLEVAVKVYRPVEIAGAAVFCSNQPEATLNFIPGQQLYLAIDGQEFLIALLDSDGRGLQQALWSRNTYLALAHYNGLACEFELTDLVGRLRKADPELNYRFSSVRHPMDTPGCRALGERASPG